jgi:dTMP kinase
MERGEIVISDRYLYSSLAYQGLARGIGIEEVFSVNRWATGGLLPDVVFLLDIAVGRVRDAYRHLSTLYPDRFLVVDASRSPDEVEQDVRQHLAAYFEESGAQPPVPTRVAST